MTRDHSLYVVRNGKIECIPMGEISIGDYILASAKYIHEDSKIDNLIIEHLEH